MPANGLRSAPVTTNERSNEKMIKVILSEDAWQYRALVQDYCDQAVLTDVDLNGATIKVELDTDYQGMHVTGADEYTGAALCSSIQNLIDRAKGC